MNRITDDKPRVLCFWDIDIDPSVLDPLRAVAEVDVQTPDREFLLEHIGEYDIYLAGLSVRFDAEIAARAGAGRTKLVYSPSTGLDHLDLDALARYNIEMRCIKTEFALLNKITATAELAFALMLAVARMIPAAAQAAMKGHWARDVFRGTQLSGKTLGILGVGRLGGMMVDFARGMRMRVIGCDPAPRQKIANLEYLPFEQMAPQCDVLSVHIHLTEENEHFLNADRLAMLKPGVIIVNTSRGRIIDESALLSALESGQIGGAGLDVIDGEWRHDLARHPLISYAREHPNVVIVPHIGGVTLESQTIVERFVAERTVRIIELWKQTYPEQTEA